MVPACCRGFDRDLRLSAEGDYLSEPAYMQSSVIEPTLDSMICDNVRPIPVHQGTGCVVAAERVDLLEDSEDEEDLIYDFDYSLPDCRNNGSTSQTTAASASKDKDRPSEDEGDDDDPGFIVSDEDNMLFKSEEVDEEMLDAGQRSVIFITYSLFLIDIRYLTICVSAIGNE